MLWVTFVTACAAIASAVFAFVQARSATDSRTDAQAARDEARVARDESARLAGEANDAFKRQAEAQEEANRIEREKLAPPDWSGPIFVNGSLYKVTNSSGGTLHVSEVEVKPDGTENLVRLSGPNGEGAAGEYEFGDSLHYLAMRAMGPSPAKLTIVYHRDGEGDERRCIIPL